MKATSSITCLGLGLLLSACAADDPKKGGFLGGLAGLGKGTYQSRVDSETSELAAEKVRHQDELDKRVDLIRSVASHRQRADDLEQRLTLLRSETKALDLEIETLREEEDLTTDRVANVEADVATLLDDINQVENDQDVQDRAKALGADADEDTDPAIFGEPPRDEVSDLRAYITKLQKAVDELKLARHRQAAEKASTVKSIKLD